MDKTKKAVVFFILLFYHQLNPVEPTRLCLQLQATVAIFATIVFTSGNSICIIFKHMHCLLTNIWFFFRENFINININVIKSLLLIIYYFSYLFDFQLLIMMMKMMIPLISTYFLFISIWYTKDQFSYHVFDYRLCWRKRCIFRKSHPVYSSISISSMSERRWLFALLMF